jgi:hypothetical protein
MNGQKVYYVRFIAIRNIGENLRRSMVYLVLLHVSQAPFIKLITNNTCYLRRDSNILISHILALPQHKLTTATVIITPNILIRKVIVVLLLSLPIMTIIDLSEVGLREEAMAGLG